MENPEEFSAEEEEEENGEENEEESDDEDYVPPGRDLINVSEGSENEEPQKSAKRTRKEEDDKSFGEKFAVSDSDLALPNCPICMERWTGQGPHRVCCIPCGHLYGRSCLERWVKRCGESFVRCPQCKKRFKVKEMVNLYAPQVSVLNDELEKELSELRQSNESLEKERNQLLDEVNKLKKYNEELMQSKKARTRRSFPGVFQLTLDEWFNDSIIPGRGQVFLPPGSEQVDSLRSILLQSEFEFDGARVVNVNACSQVLLISGKPSGWREGHSLTKISLLCPNAVQNISLSDDIGAVRDIQFSPMDTVLPGRLALFASMGKKLSIFSMESNSIVLKYALPGPAWSCSWDYNSPSFIYAGLQNGMVLTFDIRQTSSPVESSPGLSVHPVHTIYSLPGGRTGELLTASAVGPCLWAGNQATPQLVPDLENQGVCISLACGGAGTVATFRPRVSTSEGATVSQPSQGHVRLGTHVVLKKDSDDRGSGGFRRHDVTCGNVSNVRMCRSAVLSAEDGSRAGGGVGGAFIYPDEVCHGLGVWDLASFQLVHRLKPHENPILDVRFSEQSPGHGLLSCISSTKVQVFAL